MGTAVMYGVSVEPLTLITRCKTGQAASEARQQLFCGLGLFWCRMGDRVRVRERERCSDR